MATPDFEAVFTALRETMLQHTGNVHVSTDQPGHLAVETPEPDAAGKRLWLGGVQTKKRYVSYHLMGVYIDPSLLDGLSPELRKRMQGKSCFNFTTVDSALFEELSALTARSLAIRA